MVKNLQTLHTRKAALHTTACGAIKNKHAQNNYLAVSHNRILVFHTRRECFIQQCSDSEASANVHNLETSALMKVKSHCFLLSPCVAYVGIQGHYLELSTRRCVCE